VSFPERSPLCPQAKRRFLFFVKPNNRSFLLCNSFRKASVSAAEHQDLQQFVGDAAGSMPVCLQVFGSDRMRFAENGTNVK